MKPLFYILFILYGFQVSAQSPDLQWAKSSGGPSNEYSNGIAINKNGDAIYFSNTAIFLI